jgi:GNAT superfamily N-acetyltransferase
LERVTVARSEELEPNLTTALPATIAAMAQLRPRATGVRVVPANKASWQDLEAILGKVKCHGCLCFCQRYKTDFDGWRYEPDEERAHRLRMQTECGYPSSETTSGLVAYVEGEPAGWCAVEPRPAYPGLTRQVAWAGRPGEDRADPGVWAVTCMVTAHPYRRQGLTHALVAAAAKFARKQGARALEGYPMGARGVDASAGHPGDQARAVRLRVRLVRRGTSGQDSAGD